MLITFSNPRLIATFTDWPGGGSKRISCRFEVARDSKKGWRVSRTTTGKPKWTTYGGPACIVDGSDGRTYILQVATPYAFIKISRSDFMDAEAAVLGRKASVFSDGEDGELYVQLLELIKSAS